MKNSLLLALFIISISSCTKDEVIDLDSLNGGGAVQTYCDYNTVKFNGEPKFEILPTFYLGNWRLIGEDSEGIKWEILIPLLEIGDGIIIEECKFKQTKNGETLEAVFYGVANVSIEPLVGGGQNYILCFNAVSPFFELGLSVNISQ